MRLARALAGCAMLAVLFALSSDSVWSQSKDKEPPKPKGQIPMGWGKLNLTAAQKQDIYKIQTEHKEKLDKLAEEIKKVKAEEYKKMVSVLTADQKKTLAAGLTGETPEPKPKDKAKE